MTVTNVDGVVVVWPVHCARHSQQFNNGFSVCDFLVFCFCFLSTWSFSFCCCSPFVRSFSLKHNRTIVWPRYLFHFEHSNAWFIAQKRDAVCTWATPDANFRIESNWIDWLTDWDSIVSHAFVTCARARLLFMNYKSLHFLSFLSLRTKLEEIHFHSVFSALRIGYTCSSQ